MTMRTASAQLQHLPTDSMNLVRYCRLTAVLLGLCQACIYRHYMNADGISYLDIGDAYFRGDWQAAVSSYWSPLYSWLLGGVLALLQPAPYWEFATVKLFNFAIYLGALVAFEWLLRELLLWRRVQVLPPTESRLPETALLLLGYALFLVSALVLIRLDWASPDMGVALCVYLLAALLTRARRLGWQPASSAILGLVLGIAYLVKTVMLPLAAVFLAVSACACGGRKKALKHLLLAGAAWGVIASCYVTLISAKAGRFAFGDSSTFNYLWFINDVRLFRWHTDDPLLGQLQQPPRVLVVSPRVYEFATPIRGTYPLWYDPSYWLAGLRPRFALVPQLAVLGGTLWSLCRILFTSLAIYTVATAVLYSLSLATYAEPWRARVGRAARFLARDYQLLLPAVAALGTYSLVYLEERYVGAFLVLFFLAALNGLRWCSAAEARLRWWLRLLVPLALLPVMALLLGLCILAIQEGIKGEGEHVHEHWAVMQHLAAAGARPGDGVGVIGDTFECGWARLGRWRVSVQVLEGADEQQFWAAEPSRQRQTLEAFRRAGVVAVVTKRETDPGAPWVRVAGNGYYVLSFK